MGVDFVHFETQPLGVQRMPPYHMYPRVEYTLWLCQNSYWKWWFIVDFPIENGDFP